MSVPPSRNFAKIFVAALLAISLPSFANGENEPAASMFSVDGFGTLGVVHSSEHQADFVSNPSQPKGAGFTDAWSATPDTKLGIQLNASLTPKLSSIVQFVSHYRYNGTFTPELEWANLKFQFTPDLSIRAGRIALPVYMFSDSINIGYVLPYVRIPAEIDAQLPISHSDGIDGSYRFHVGEIANTIQPYVGAFKTKLPHGGTFKTGDLRGVADNVEFRGATIHFAYQSLHYDLAFAGEVLNDMLQKMAVIGAGYDPGRWYVSGEWIRTFDAAFGLFYAWDVNGGYRIGKFTPYFVYATTWMSRVGSMGFPPFIYQSTTSVGTRWDFMKNVDLKVQLDRSRRHGGFNQYFVNQQPGFQERGKVDLITLTFDFVF